MRAVLTDCDELSFDELSAFVAERSPFRVRAIGDRDWAEFEAVNHEGRTVLAADLTTGSAAREELDELEELLEDLDGPENAREAVKAHLQRASGVVGMQMLMSVYDDSAAAANAIIDYLEQRPRVLTQVDTVGWYDGPNLILQEPD